MSGLAAQQAELVAALTGTGEIPAGFDIGRMQIARKALLRKRAGEVSARWPMLAAGLGRDFFSAFAGFAEHRPTRGSLRDGWDFARSIRDAGRLPQLAEFELAKYESDFDYDGVNAPTVRSGLKVTRGRGFTMVRWGRRTLVRDRRAG